MGLQGEWRLLAGARCWDHKKGKKKRREPYTHGASSKGRRRIEEGTTLVISRESREDALEGGKERKKNRDRGCDFFGAISSYMNRLRKKERKTDEGTQRLKT